MQFANRCRNIMTNPKYGVADLSEVEDANKVKALTKEVERLNMEKHQLEEERNELNRRVESYEQLEQKLNQQQFYQPPPSSMRTQRV